MKKSLIIRNFFLLPCLILFFGNLQLASSQEKVTLPDDINKIVQVSCMPCHGSKGGFMATSKLNFAKWEEYDSKKKSNLSSKICEEVTKGKMPPEDARKKRPEIVPTKEQIETLCKWAESLKPSDKEE